MKYRCAYRKISKASVIKGGILTVSLIIDAICVLLWMEVIARDSYNNTLIWFLENTTYALANAGLIYIVLWMLTLLCERLSIALSVGNLFFLIIGMIQKIKLDLRGTPLKLSDVFFVREGMQAAVHFLDGGIETNPRTAIAVGLMVIVVPVLYCGVRCAKRKFNLRIICVLFACVLLRVYIPFIAATQFKSTLQWADQFERGTLLSFFDERTIMEEPEGYNEDAIHRLLMAHAGENTVLEEKPHVLFVMSESLFDISEDFELSKDPMKYFKELQEKYWGGVHLSNSYGGGTAAVEYEVLTGYRSQDTSGIVYMPDKGVIKWGMDSVVSAFNQNGYFTQAMHPNSGGFYSRESAYKVMGFEDMKFIDDLSPVPEEVFPFPSDEYFYNEIIRAFEERPNGRPWFC